MKFIKKMTSQFYALCSNQKVGKHYIRIGLERDKNGTVVYEGLKKAKERLNFDLIRIKKNLTFEIPSRITIQSTFDFSFIVILDFLMPLNYPFWLAAFFLFEFYGQGEIERVLDGRKSSNFRKKRHPNMLFHFSFLFL